MSIVFTKRTKAPSPVIVSVYNENSTTLARGLAINIYNGANRTCARLADNTSINTLCHGFAIRDIEPQSWGEIKTGGPIEILINASPGQPYFLDVDGKIVTQAPYQPFIEDKIIQMVGYAASSSVLYIKIEQPVGINLPPAPEAPLLLEPNNHSTVHNPVYFNWQPIIGSTSADYYNIQISQYSNFISNVKDENINETFVTYSLPNGTYYWRVASVAFSERSDWSTIYSFRVS